LAQQFEVVCYGTTPTHRLRDLIEDGTYLDFQGPFTQWREYYIEQAGGISRPTT
jgi:hypothetical protein